MHYPGDYGFIPRTLHEDDDPLDVLVRIKEPTFPGCQIDVRPIGVLKMLDRGEPDDKILAVPCTIRITQEYFDIADIPQHYLKEVEHFFHIYKDLEGKRVEIMGWEKSDEACQVITESIARYEAMYGVRKVMPVEAASPRARSRLWCRHTTIAIATQARNTMPFTTHRRRELLERSPAAQRERAEQASSAWEDRRSSRSRTEVHRHVHAKRRRYAAPAHEDEPEQNGAERGGDERDLPRPAVQHVEHRGDERREDLRRPEADRRDQPLEA